MADLSALLKAVNARKEAGSARLEGEEATKALEALAERDFARQLAEQAAAAEPAEPPDLKRSTMSASAKSAYIRARGLDKYNRLPFK